MKRTKRKALGQHFLSSRNVLQKIAKRINPRENDFIIEIGAGKGALTALLAQKTGKIIAIEKDPSFAAFLRSKAFPMTSILEKDVLKVDFQELVKKTNVKLVGNLPYSISSPILFKVLAEKELFPECIFLLQREVAERLCANPGSKKYAPLSIFFQNYYSTNLHFIVSPDSFSPPPQVESALVSLKKRKRPLFSIKNEERFRKFLKVAFQHRRKKLSNNLKKTPVFSGRIKVAMQECGLDENIRAEQVPLSGFVSLYNYFYNLT